MSAPIDGVAGRVHADGSLPPAPHNSSLEYTAKLTPSSGLYIPSRLKRRFLQRPV
jgi:hypothetical protein